MASRKIICNQISTIQSTRKITIAMEQVAASKTVKAKKNMRAALPYANKIKHVIQHLSQGNLEYQHVFFTERNVKNIGYIIVSTDRGLCGGLNSNLFRHTLKELELKKTEFNDPKFYFCTLGRKGESFFKRLKGTILASVHGFGDTPQLNQLIGPLKVMLDAFIDGRLDQLFLVSNEFVSTMVQKPRIEQLLPISASQLKLEENHAKYKSWDYIYEPSAQDLIEMLLTRYLESMVYRSVIENIACEQSARMLAMKNASDNAGELIDELLLKYNKARQAAITQELSEIVAGAAAV